MHPELLNNSLFLRYYGQWQKDPSSVVFVPIADYFMRYGLIDDATKVCKQGIKEHPSLISGHLMMARICIERKEWTGAVDSIRRVLSIVPGHNIAMELMNVVEANRIVRRGDVGEIKSETESVPQAKPVLKLEPKPKPKLEPKPELTPISKLELESKPEPSPKPESDFVFEPVAKKPRTPSWETITMANIYSAQGHHARAREIYEAILSKEPENVDAKRGLEYLSKVDHP